MNHVDAVVSEAREFLRTTGILSAVPSCPLCGIGDAMRRAGRRDTSHAEIRDGLRQLGFTVVDLGNVGDGCPDLLASKHSKTWLIECKGPKTPISAGQLEFAQTWQGAPVIFARTLDEALAELGVVAA